MLAVQGPIVDLHKSLSRLVHQRVQYRAKGTGLVWLDYDQKKSNAITVRTIARRKLLLQDTNPLFDCASCKGSLHAADYFYLLGLLTACISVSAMLPVIIKVAVTSGNGVGHVFVALACKELFWYTVLLFCKFKCCLLFRLAGKEILGRGYSNICYLSSGYCCVIAAFAGGVADPTSISWNVIFGGFGWIPDADQLQAVHGAWCSPSCQPGLGGVNFARLVGALREPLCSDQHFFFCWSIIFVLWCIVEVSAQPHCIFLFTWFVSMC